MTSTKGVPRRVVIGALVATVVVAVVVAALVGGAESARGALVGGIIGALFVAAGPWLLEPITRDNPGIVVPATLALFLGKAIVVIAVLVVLAGWEPTREWLEIRALALAMVAVVLVSVNLQLVDFRNRRVPTYDLDSPSS